MSPRYHGKGGKRVTYQCDQRRQKDGDYGICWSVAGAAIEIAVTEHVLDAITASQLDLSLAVLGELEQVTQEQHRQWQLRLERVRYEAQRAERQFDAVEPENRLVARTLEKRWNEKLQEVAEVEQAYMQAQRVQRLELTDIQRQQILQLAQDLPAIWQAPTTTVQEQKEMLGLLVKQIALTPIDEPERCTRVKLLWHTVSTTEVTTKRPTIQQRLGTPEVVIQAVRELAYGRTDSAIAEALNEKGLTSATGHSFTASSVAWIRLKFKIPKPESDNRVAFHIGIREDGWYTTSALAQKLGVGINTIHYWREKGVVPAIRETPHGPWWHQVTPEILQELRQKIRRVPLKQE